MRSRLALLALVGTLALPACGGEHPATSAGAPVVDAGHGLSVRLPPAWRLADTSLTPHLTDPREVLSAGTFPLRYRPGPCAQFPVSALDDLGPGDAFVTLQERGLDPGSSWPDFPSRPAGFGSSLGGPSEASGCVSNAGFAEHFFNFTDGDRHFDAQVVFGSQVSPAVRAQAWGILDSLRVDPSVRPDWHATP